MISLIDEIKSNVSLIELTLDGSTTLVQFYFTLNSILAFRVFKTTCFLQKLSLFFIYELGAQYKLLQYF